MNGEHSTRNGKQLMPWPASQLHNISVSFCRSACQRVDVNIWLRAHAWKSPRKVCNELRGLCASTNAAARRI